jgi:hypothetical protein
MRSTMKKALLVAVIAAFAAFPALADSFTSSASFFAAISGLTPTTANFDSDPVGNIAQGATVDGITFTYTVDGGLESLAVQNTFDTTSGKNYLGSNDAGTGGALFPGDTFTMSFSTPINAVGFFIIGGPYSTGDFTLSSLTATATSSNVLEETLGDGGQVIFLGIASNTDFSSATVTLDPSAGELWNVDDITTAAGPVGAPLPEPDTLSLLAVGLAVCIFVASRKSAFAPRAASRA